MTRTLLRLATVAILAAGMLAVPAAATAARTAGVDAAIGDTEAAQAGAGAETAPAAGGTESHALPAPPDGRFKLVLKPESAPTVVASLRCRPHGGSHPRTDDACADLDEVNGRIGDIPAESGACTREFAPVTAFAIGVWDGGPRIYKHRFSNGCEAVKRTGGAVFDFS